MPASDGVKVAHHPFASKGLKPPWGWMDGLLVDGFDGRQRAGVEATWRHLESGTGVKVAEAPSRIIMGRTGTLEWCLIVPLRQGSK